MCRVFDGAVLAITDDVMGELSESLLFGEEGGGVLNPPDFGFELLYELQAPAGRLEALF